MRGFRRVLLARDAARAGSRSSSRLALFVPLALSALRFVPQQFFPSSDRPELLVDLQLPQNASIYATRDSAVTGSRSCCRTIPDVDHWSTYVGQGAVRFYLPLNVQLPNDFFAQAVVVTKGWRRASGVRGAAGAGARRAISRASSAASTRWSSGPPVGWPLQYRVSGPDAGPGARHRLQGRQTSLGTDPGTAQDQLQLDGAGAHGADPGRPGPGAPAGPQLAGTWPRR